MTVRQRPLRQLILPDDEQQPAGRQRHPRPPLAGDQQPTSAHRPYGGAAVGQRGSGGEESGAHGGAHQVRERPQHGLARGAGLSAPDTATVQSMSWP